MKKIQVKKKVKFDSQVAAAHLGQLNNEPYECSTSYFRTFKGNQIPVKHREGDSFNSFKSKQSNRPKKRLKNLPEKKN